MEPLHVPGKNRSRFSVRSDPRPRTRTFVLNGTVEIVEYRQSRSTVGSPEFPKLWVSFAVDLPASVRKKQWKLGELSFPEGNTTALQRLFLTPLFVRDENWKELSQSSKYELSVFVIQ